MTRERNKLDRLRQERDQYARSVSELSEKFDEKVEELSFVRQLGDALGSSLDLNTLCRHTVDIVQESLGPENCSIMLLDEQSLYLVAARGAYDDQAATFAFAAQDASFELGEGVAGIAAATQTPIRIDNTADYEPFIDDRDHRVIPKSLLTVPLQSRGKVIGVINLSDSLPDAFESKHERIIALITNAVAMAIENAMLFSEVTESRERLASENLQLKQQLSDRFSVDGLIGNSPPFRRALRLVEKVADTTANVLITGESGTGKEVVARTVHFSSARKDGPFIAVNCAALPETLLEAELFGIEKGVATGVDARAGTFEKAHGGTLFLDEIGDMSPAVQVRLLRVLQERQVTRVGSQQPLSVDVRVVSATHRNLLERISGGHFREDLYYRLKVIEIQLPALRERREDILQLAAHFANRFAKRHSRPRRDFSRAAARALLHHKWSGNVRELEHTIEQAILLAEGEQIELIDLGLDEPTSDGLRLELPEQIGEFHDTLSEIQDIAEQAMIRKALAETDGNRTRAAALLGIARRTLNYKLRKHELS
ncbi:MAG: sigma-54-dependent Fis family transcriptional regulator [Myxococcota bacterium]|nr:sigma-54-dependent Fis family transcriptional regulator [Myxococcota bacterium]